ncbi:MAG: hypothetical protein ABIS38_05190 [Sphingomicrobium sp.]
MKHTYKNNAGAIARALRDRAVRPMPAAVSARARDAVAYAAALEILG